MAVYIGELKIPKGTLPEGYTRLEYIKSSGTQHIDTGFIPNQDTRVVCEGICDVASSTNWLYGARGSSSAQQFGFVYSAGGYYLTAYNTTQTQFASSMSSSKKMTIDANKATTTLTSNGTTASVTGASGTFSTGYTLILFGCNTAGTISKGTGTIYSFQIYNNGVLVRNFIPCTNAAGTAGLYDTVGSKFYTNAGSGSFAVGAVVEEVLGDPVDNIAHKVSKIYVGIDGVAKAVKKGYIGVDGVAQLFYSALSAKDVPIAYTGNYTDEIVTMGDGKQYRLLTLTSSGTLTLESELKAELFLVGGGYNGAAGTKPSGYRYGGDGGNGGKFIQGSKKLSTSQVVTIGSAGGGTTSVAGVISTADSGAYSGAGGGKKGVLDLDNYAETNGSHGAAAAMSSLPFLDSYFTKLPCAGGGGGAAGRIIGGTYYYGNGGNGGSTIAAGSGSQSRPSKGGNTGGGAGSNAADAGKAATYYGSGGGGGGVSVGGTTQSGSAGYQGVVFIRIPL